jgi:hypothetical protein
MIRLFLLLIIASATLALSPQQPSQPLNPVGRWQVKFTLLSSPEKNLIFTAQEGGEGAFKLLDTGPDDKPVAADQAAAWSLTNGHLSISGEVELPIGTCCRETGTLIFKSKPTATNSFSGKLIFVTNIDEEEGPYRYHATIGTFTATRLPRQ